MNIRASAKRVSALVALLIAVVPAVFFFVGIPDVALEKDAAGYSAYAANLVTGHGYSLDGRNFSSVREPGYPVFIASLYALFGIENLFAIFVAQAILLGLLGVLTYRLFAEAGRESAGMIAGLCIALLPSYGLYTHIVGTELLFAFLLGILLYLTVRIARDELVSWKWFALWGFVCSVATLVRVQLVFFLPFMVLWYILLRRAAFLSNWRKVAVGCATFIAVVGAWIGVVYVHTGTPTITDGRQEWALYIRGVRAQLSYAELTRYAAAWVRRSLSGGDTDPLLDKYEFKQLEKDYTALATTTAAAARIKQQSIAAIAHNPGHYLYGNAIELVKLTYIEHDYRDFLNRYLRAGMYALMYALFLLGLFEMFRKDANPTLALIAKTAGIFILYNLIILTPFDTIPRYNTPYLFLYLIAGVCGVSSYIERYRRRKEITILPR